MPLVCFANSSALIAANYDTDHRHLRVIFRDHSAYTYFAVPPQVYEDLLEATSKGSYFNRNVRGKFAYERTPVDAD